MSMPNQDEERLIIKKKKSKIVIYFQAFQSELENSNKDMQDSKKQLILIDLKSDKFDIFPIFTFPERANFLEPKYSNIDSITLDGFNINKPETIEDLEDILQNMPTGFIKNHEYGLGLQKDYRFIINTISEINNITNLVISKSLNTQIKGSSYILNYSDFEKIRKGINAITRKYQSDILIDKIIFSYNSLLHQVYPTIYKEKSRPYKKDTIFKMVSNNLVKDISKKDGKSIINLIKQNKQNIYQNDKEEILNFINEIELINLEDLIKKIKEKINNNLSESYWQKLFNDNPFILSLAFGYPAVKIGGQVTVGGRKLSGSGDKITDFMLKNNITDNLALVEIKRPDSPLLFKTEYRDGVYSPSRELSGSINQMLDQKFHLNQEISIFKSNSKIYDIETYNINCVLIIGKVPTSENQKKSFELFRNNSKDIIILTFDELLKKLEFLHEFLLSSKCK